jgi:hypothetical protein
MGPPETPGRFSCMCVKGAVEVGPVELAECFPVPGIRFRVVGQVSGAVNPWRAPPGNRAAPDGRGRHSPHRCPHKRTLIGTTGRWLAHDGQIKPERPNDQRERSGGSPAHRHKCWSMGLHRHHSDCAAVCRLVPFRLWASRVPHRKEGLVGLLWAVGYPDGPCVRGHEKKAARVARSRSPLAAS